MSRSKGKPGADSPQPFVPLLLRETPRWCRWKLVRDRRGELTKRPDCSTKDPNARRTFGEVRRHLDPTNSRAGIGFITGGRVETPRGFLVALDYDNCRDPKTGVISPWASNAMREAFGGSFTEVSPSGYGLRQWLLVPHMLRQRTRSVIPIQANMVPGCSKKVEVQVFGLNAHGGGYVTVTGNWLNGTSREVLRIKGVEAIYEAFDFAAGLEANDEELVDLPAGEGVPPSLDEIDVMVRRQPQGQALVEGDWEETKHPSASEAFFELEQRVLVAANGHGEAALDYLLERTAWGFGDIENSHDASKYERESWVRNELLRTCGKTYVSGTADAFDVIDEDEAEREVEAIKQRAEHAVDRERQQSAARSPIAQIRAPDFSSMSSPPRREYLLSHPDGVGLLPRAKVGLLSAAGGAGKTTALVQLAIAVATRRRWFEHFRVGETCGRRVLFLMGEEDEEEVRRKLFYTTNAMRLTPIERAAVAEHVECLPLAGHALPLLSANREGVVLSTPHADALMQRLDAGDNWGLVIVDPISRFAGINVEADNILATRFVQELERFTRALGKPTVLGVGHTSKQARAQGSAEQRGVTGLIDAVRFGASMLTRNDGRVVFEIQKNNYAPPTTEPVMLVRGEEGHLTVEGAEQRQEREAQERRREAERAIERDRPAVDARERRIASLVESISQTVRDHPGKTANELVSLVTGRRSSILDAIRRVESAGDIEARTAGRRTEYWPVSLLD